MDNKNYEEVEDIVEFTNEEGDTMNLRLLDYFYYNGEEYAFFVDAENTEDEEGDLFIMHVNSFTDENGEEMEEFESPDDELLPALIEAAKTKFDIVDLDEE